MMLSFITLNIGTIAYNVIVIMIFATTASYFHVCAENCIRFFSLSLHCSCLVRLTETVSSLNIILFKGLML